MFKNFYNYLLNGYYTQRRSFGKRRSMQESLSYFRERRREEIKERARKISDFFLEQALMQWRQFNKVSPFIFQQPNVCSGRKLTQQANFEMWWTILPAVVLIILAFPSMKLLYCLDFLIYDYEPVITVKVIGHQWFWSYEYVVFSSKDVNFFTGELVNIESYLLSETEIAPDGLRLLEVDNPLVIPTHFYVRFLVTSVDVLHSWAIPALGIKVDAVPGRLNQAFTFIKRDGNFYGQCSEICGVNHGFMPIRIYAKLNT
jgi:heme/copper-type cytochrome/quinol oxidase subunit 2